MEVGDGAVEEKGEGLTICLGRAARHLGPVETWTCAAEETLT